jgi:hypothetical protein
MFNRQRIQWSPLETDWLKENRDKQPLQQLSIILAKTNAAIKRKLNEFDGKVKPKDKSKRKTKIGKRPDLEGLFVRSAWEANTLRWLKYANRPFLYEPKVFHFDKVKHGTVSYLPDIYLPEEDIYIEVKGMLDSHGRTAINRFQKYYPEEAKKLRVIVGSMKTKAAQFFINKGIPIIGTIQDLNKQYKKIISEWEV